MEPVELSPEAFRAYTKGRRKHGMGGAKKATYCICGPDGKERVIKEVSLQAYHGWLRAFSKLRSVIGQGLCLVMAAFIATVKLDPSPERNPTAVSMALVFPRYTGPLDKLIPELGPNIELSKWILAGLVTSLDKLHTHNLLHGDIKPDNILLQYTRGHDGDFKFFAVLFADFDNATIGSGKFTDSYPSALYVQPDAVRTEMSTAAADLYSFGLVIMWLFGGFEYVYADGRVFAGEAAALYYAKWTNAVTPKWTKEPTGELAWLVPLVGHCISQTPLFTIHDALAVIESNLPDQTKYFGVQLEKAQLEPDFYGPLCSHAKAIEGGAANMEQ
tara:strand:- start:259 stop:1248 length:990 start_codon:yes stop_codon:yes gene_type:complete